MESLGGRGRLGWKGLVLCSCCRVVWATQEGWPQEGGVGLGTKATWGPGPALLSDPGQAQLSLSVSHLCPEGRHPHTTPASLGLPWDDRPRPWACNRLGLCRERCVNGLAVEMGPSKRTGTREVCHNWLPSRHRGLEMATSGDSCSRASCVQSWPSSHTTTTSSSLCFHRPF